MPRRLEKHTYGSAKYPVALTILLIVPMMLGFASNSFAQALSQQFNEQQLWQLHLDPTNKPAQNSSNATILNLDSESPALTRILVHPETLKSHNSGDIISVDVGPDFSGHYIVRSRHTLSNGDINLIAELESEDEKYLLSLTYNSQIFLAKGFTPFGKFSAIAPLVNDLYEGELHQTRIETAILPSYFEHPNDLAKLSSVRGFNAQASTAADFSIKQQGDREYTIEGQTLTITITVTNNTAIAQNNLDIELTTALDTANFISSNVPCSEQNNEGDKVLICQLGDIAASSEKQFLIGLQATSLSFPQLRNSIELNKSSQTTFFDVSRDILRDSDGDGLGDYLEELAGTDPQNGSSVFNNNQIVTVDLLVYYTPHFVGTIGHNQPVTEINQQLAFANALFSRSDARVRFRAVLSKRVEYQVGEDLFNAHNDLRHRKGVFADKALLEKLSGADAVLLIDGNTQLSAGTGSCGVGDIAGSGSFGDLGHFSAQFKNHVVISYPGGANLAEGTSCSDDLLAHELGHIMGLAHSKVDTGTPGTFSWSRGYGVSSRFKTIMASNQAFGLLASVPYFSNPRIFECDGLACGVDRSDLSNGADSALAINITRLQVASNEKEVPQLAVASLSGSNTNAAFFGGAIQSADPHINQHTFSNRIPHDEKFSVMGIANVASADVGLLGRFHAVIVVPGIGMFQANEAGEYFDWDGQVSNLIPYKALSVLPEQQEIFAFRDFVAKNFDISDTQLGVYFAYSVNGRDDLVFTESGINFSIFNADLED